MVPGNRLVYTQTFNVNATGDDLLFNVASTSGAITAVGVAVPANVALAAALNTAGNSTFTVSAPAGGNVVATGVTANTYKLNASAGPSVITVTWTITLPFGATRRQLGQERHRQPVAGCHHPDPGRGPVSRWGRDPGPPASRPHTRSPPFLKPIRGNEKNTVKLIAELAHLRTGRPALRFAGAERRRFTVKAPRMRTVVAAATALGVGVCGAVLAAGGSYAYLNSQAARGSDHERHGRDRHTRTHLRQ